MIPIHLLNDSVSHRKQTDEQVQQQDGKVEVPCARCPEHLLGRNHGNVENEVPEVEDNNEFDNTD